MSTYESSGQEASESIDEQRAQYEQFEFAVCGDGEHVNVRNTSYDEPGHVYSVTVEAGEVVACSCPHHEHRGVRCKHIRACANEPVLLAAVEAAKQEQEQEVRDDSGISKPYTTHLEGPEQGGERYARCTGCEREIIPVGRFDKLTHADGCPNGGDGR